MVTPHPRGTRTDLFRRHWFLLALTTVSIVGLGGHRWLQPIADQAWLRNGIVASVLFLMALPLETSSLGRSLLTPLAPLLGIAINMVALPLLAWGLTPVLERALQDELLAGILVTTAVPCTLASAAVWTRRAGGNDSVAVLVTVLTNLTCFIVTPFWLRVTTGSEVTPATLRQLQMLPLRLIWLVVLPMVVAQLLRRHAWFGNEATRHRNTLGILAQVGILSMVLIGAIQSGEHLSQARGFAWGQFPLLALVTAGLHGCGLLMGMITAKGLGLGRPEQIAVAISGSQKTLMIGLDIALQAFGGIAIVPMVMYHFLQLMIDTVLADRLAKK